MGNQGHTFEGMKYIREWYEAGLLGEVREVHAWTNRTTKNITNAKKTPEKGTVPSGLDWDKWIGPYGQMVGLDRFGASAPYQTIYEQLGFTVDNIVLRALESIDKSKK